MKPASTTMTIFSVVLCITIGVATHATAQERAREAAPPAGGPTGPAPRGGGFGPPGGVQESMKLVEKFDRDNNQRLDAGERKTAREFIVKERAEGRGRRGPGFRGRNETAEPPQPGRKVAVSDVKPVVAPFYDLKSLRTLFLDFENPEWEKELADFYQSDVEVPATLTVDGKTYPNVGVHFRGASSFFTVGEGRKRSFNLSMDFVNEDQRLHGYRTLNLLNSHTDPTYLRTVLYSQIAREYIAAPKANYVHLVVNGESWGVYVNAQQFNKDFTKEWFGSTKGARWKVPGSPGGRGGLTYLGEDPAPYKKIYEIKSKDDPKAWAVLIQLCRVLNETPADQLEAALSPLLDIDSVLKFLALENVFINNDGYWVRASDYNLYQDEKGRFHVVPHDANETFSRPGGPGFGGPRGPGGPGGFGPGGMIGSELFSQADRDKDEKLTRAELHALAQTWFEKLDAGREGKITSEQFADRFSAVLPPPPGFDGPGGNPGAGFIAAPLFSALTGEANQTLTLSELQKTFNQWFARWDRETTGSLTAEQVRNGINDVLPAPNFAGRGGAGGRGGGGPRINGVELDPLISATDTNKPLISKLLAVPSLRERYLGYVRHMTENWLDWNNVEPITKQYQSLIAEEVKVDTRKLDSFEAFRNGVSGGAESAADSGESRRGSMTLKAFVEQRRAYLLGRPEVQSTRARKN